MNKCKECKWLTGRVSSIGIECMQSENQKKWNAQEEENKKNKKWLPQVTARYKQKSAKACKRFERREDD